MSCILFFTVLKHICICSVDIVIVVSDDVLYYQMKTSRLKMNDKNVFLLIFMNAFLFGLHKPLSCISSTRFKWKNSALVSVFWLCSAGLLLVHDFIAHLFCLLKQTIQLCRRRGGQNSFSLTFFILKFILFSFFFHFLQRWIKLTAFQSILYCCTIPKVI